MLRFVGASFGSDGGYKQDDACERAVGWRFEPGTFHARRQRESCQAWREAGTVAWNEAFGSCRAIHILCAEVDVLD